MMFAVKFVTVKKSSSLEYDYIDCNLTNIEVPESLEKLDLVRNHFKNQKIKIDQIQFGSINFDPNACLILLTEQEARNSNLFKKDYKIEVKCLNNFIDQFVSIKFEYEFKFFSKSQYHLSLHLDRKKLLNHWINSGYKLILGEE